MDPWAAAELAAGYLVEHARRASGVKYRQGRWHGEFARELELFGAPVDHAPGLEFLRRERVRRVPERALRGLFTWARGFGVELRRDVPRAGEVLALQAAGRRCVSLLPDDVSPAPHASGLDFLIHDLCHLEKFADPRHHAEQVGFFRTLQSLPSSSFRGVERELDEAWVRDRDWLAADVNGSAVYLFSLLKMKLKMAARRLHARAIGAAPRVSGALDEHERAVFERLEAALYDGMELFGELRRAAQATSARRDDLASATLVAAEFRRRGGDASAPT